jgi:hypothetical protein
LILRGELLDAELELQNCVKSDNFEHEVLVWREKCKSIEKEIEDLVASVTSYPEVFNLK